jgi:hypothetical protein
MKLCVLLRVVVAALALVAAPPVASAKPRGAAATVRLTVDAGSGLVQPVVRYELRRCGRGFGEEVALGLVAAGDGRFVVRDRHRRGRALVRLRLAGVFESGARAHGSLRGRVTFGGHRRPRACTIPGLRWTASLRAPGEGVEGSDDEALPDLEFVIDDDELEEGEFEEDDEPVEDDDPGDDDSGAGP